MAQFGEKIWFRRIGEDGVSCFASRMTQESLLVIMIEQEQFCALQEWSCARQKLDKTDTE